MQMHRTTTLPVDLALQLLDVAGLAALLPLGLAVVQGRKTQLRPNAVLHRLLRYRGKGKERGAEVQRVGEAGQQENDKVSRETCALSVLLAPLPRLGGRGPPPLSQTQKM